MNFFKKFSTFHKIFFSVFAIINLILFIVPAIQTGSIMNLISISSLIELISTFAGLFAAIYTARGEVACYIWGFINALVYIYIVFTGHMYGQAILYTFFKLPMQIVGYYAWKKSIENTDGTTVEVKKLTKKNWIVLVITFILVWIGYGIFLKCLPSILQNLFNITISADKEFIVDSLSSTLIIYAVILSTKRFVEQWYFWLLSNSIGILLFVLSLISSKKISVDTLSGMIIWIQFTLNAIYGFYNWRKLNNKNA